MSESGLPEVVAEDWVSVLAGQHPERRDIPDIGILVQRHIDRTGDSLRQLQRRSGDKVQHSMWDRLAKNTIKEFPKPDSIPAIAAALSLSETVVVLAIAKSLGVNVSFPSSGPQIPIPANAEQLDDQGRRLVWDMITALLPPVTEAQARARVRRRARSSDPDPGPQA